MEIYPRMREFMRAFHSNASRGARRASLKVVAD
jgi:hypothetical protein